MIIKIVESDLSASVERQKHATRVATYNQIERVLMI